MLRKAAIKDAEALASIYNYYILETAITFEEDAITGAEMEKRISEISAEFPFFVWEEDGEILGYAYSHQFKERCAYRYTLEDSIYLKRGCEGRGIGTALLREIISDAKNRGTHVMMSVITVPNERSVALHEKCGFVKKGQFEEVGYKFGRWLDVGYWELKL
jgi:phosphinothricin acetyltransferase